MTELLLVRHGQSTWNAAGRVQGQTAAPGLTDLGRRQAAAATGTPDSGNGAIVPVRLA